MVVNMLVRVCVFTLPMRLSTNIPSIKAIERRVREGKDKRQTLLLDVTSAKQIECAPFCTFAVEFEQIMTLPCGRSRRVMLYIELPCSASHRFEHIYSEGKFGFYIYRHTAILFAHQEVMKYTDGSSRALPLRTKKEPRENGKRDF